MRDIEIRAERPGDEPALTLPDVPPQYFQAVVLAGELPGGVVKFDAAFEAKA